MSKPARRSPRTARAYDLAADTSQLSFVQRGRRETEAGAGPSAAHAFDIADAMFDAGCADVAAEYGVARPAAVISRYITEWPAAQASALALRVNYYAAVAAADEALTDTRLDAFDRLSARNEVHGARVLLDEDNFLAAAVAVDADAEGRWA